MKDILNIIIITGSLFALAVTIGLSIGWLKDKYPLTDPIPASDSPIETRTAQIWRVTAYCPCEKCCGRFSDGITASGYKIRSGDQLVAAPKSIPFHTWIYIPRYSDEPVEVLDRGGAIKGRRLDVFFSTHQEALNWGVKWLEIKL